MRRRPTPERLSAVKVRVGVDLVSVQRLTRLLHDHPGATNELFTTAELAYCDGKRRRAEHLAARFAAKEAVLKAMGTGLGQGMRWADVEVRNTSRGRPIVCLAGAVAARARACGISDIDISLTHTAGLAMAHAVVISGGGTERPAEDRDEGASDGDALSPD